MNGKGQPLSLHKCESGPVLQSLRTSAAARARGSAPAEGSLPGQRREVTTGTPDLAQSGPSRPAEEPRGPQRVEPASRLFFKSSAGKTEICHAISKHN